MSRRTTENPLRDRALVFRPLHVQGRPLVLPNAWDIAGARIVEDAGAAAVATTGAGLSWTLGSADGDRALAAVADIATAVEVPVSADVESGHAGDATGVADTVRAVLAAGAVGMNVEDALCEAGTGPLRPSASRRSERNEGPAGRSPGEHRDRP